MPGKNDKPEPGLVNPAELNPDGKVPVVVADPEQKKGPPRDAGGAQRPGDQRHGMSEDDVDAGDQ